MEIISEKVSKTYMDAKESHSEPLNKGFLQKLPKDIIKNILYFFNIVVIDEDINRNIMIDLINEHVNQDDLYLLSECYTGNDIQKDEIIRIQDEITKKPVLHISMGRNSNIKKNIIGKCNKENIFNGHLCGNFSEYGGYNCLEIPEGFNAYYTSPAFKELQIYRMMHGISLMDYFNDEGIIFMSDLIGTLGYSKGEKVGITKENDDYFSGISGLKYLNNERELYDFYTKYNFNYTHAYKTKSSSRLFDIMNYHNIEKLIFKDDNSPFYFSKQLNGIPELNIKSYLDKSIYDFFKTFRDDIPDHIDKLNVNALWLCVATGFHLTSNKNFYKLRRNSKYEYDYFIFRLIEEYLVTLGFDGIYQSSGVFHSEYDFFSPSIRKVLVPDYHNRFSWHQMGNLPKSLKRKPSIKPTKRNTCKSKEKGILDQCEIISGKACELHLDELYDKLNEIVLPNNGHHIGETLAEHGLWTAKALENWFQFRNHPIVGEIWPELEDVCQLAGFIHDIGKVSVGSAPEHPTAGYDFLKEVDSSVESIAANFIGLYTDCTINKHTILIFKIVVYFHHWFGELLLGNLFILPDSIGNPGAKYPKNYNWEFYHYQEFNIETNNLNNMYAIINIITPLAKYFVFLSNILDKIKEIDPDSLFLTDSELTKQLLHILMAVSNADVYGTFPLDEHPINNTPLMRSKSAGGGLNITGKEPSSLSNYFEFNRPFFKYFNLERGLNEIGMVINAFDLIVDINNFVEAWTNFKGFVENLETERVKVVEPERIEEKKPIVEEPPVEDASNQLYNFFKKMFGGARPRKLKEFDTTKLPKIYKKISYDSLESFTNDFINLLKHGILPANPQPFNEEAFLALRHKLAMEYMTFKEFKEIYNQHNTRLRRTRTM